jgi:hypothetical protein
MTTPVSSGAIASLRQTVEGQIANGAPFVAFLPATALVLVECVETLPLTKRVLLERDPSQDDKDTALAAVINALAELETHV